MFSIGEAFDREAVGGESRRADRGDAGKGGSSASPNRATRSSSDARSRAVAATLSPRSSAAIAHSRPNPRDVPVMNHTFDVMVLTVPHIRSAFPSEACSQLRLAS